MIAKLQQLASISGNGIIPILSCLHYDGNGAFTASDLQNTMRISGLNIGVDKPFCVDAKDFVNIIKSLGSDVVITANDGLVFKSGKSKYKLPIQDPEDFPKLTDVDPGGEVTVKPDQLKDLINSTLFSVGKDELRMSMTGIKFGDNHVVATDSHRMVICDSEIDLDFILPSATARVILASFDGNEVAISQNDGSIKFVSGNTTLVSTKITERYPNWEAVVPKNNPYKLKIGTSHLISALSRILLVSNNMSNMVVFRLGDESTITADDNDFKTSGVEEITCDYQGEPLVIGFNGKIMLEAIRTIVDEEILISFSHPNRAALAEANGKTLLFMPMMVSQD